MLGSTSGINNDENIDHDELYDGDVASENPTDDAELSEVARQELPRKLLHHGSTILQANIARRSQETTSGAVDSEAFILEENQTRAIVNMACTRHCSGDRFVKPLLAFPQPWYPEPLSVVSSGVVFETKPTMLSTSPWV